MMGRETPRLRLLGDQALNVVHCQPDALLSHALRHTHRCPCRIYPLLFSYDQLALSLTLIMVGLEKYAWRQTRQSMRYCRRRNGPRRRVKHCAQTTTRTVLPYRDATPTRQCARES
jgi:hypothetical protein